ncbi:MAG: hypothetical protein AAF191_04300 [Verrucomicrobiota bacterium]
MESLQAHLDAIHQEFERNAPPEALAVMHRSTEDLIASGLHEQAIKTGDSFPDFDLQDGEGTSYQSENLFGDRPIIINFFRGHW